MKKNNQFEKKFILLTGASSGIGFQIAKDFLQQGGHVGLHYSTNFSTVKKLSNYGNDDQYIFLKSDFSKSNQVIQFWNEFIEWSKGRIDLLINNASIANFIPYEKLSENEWNKTFEINVRAPFQLSKLAFSIMAKKENGRIINISSGGWTYGGNSNSIHFGASKAALESLTIAFAKMGAQHNILVNTIRPGATATKGHLKRYKNEKDLENRTNLVPLKRMAKPHEISNMVQFLASKESSFITNTIMKVSGGE